MDSGGSEKLQGRERPASRFSVLLRELCPEEARLSIAEALAVCRPTCGSSSWLQSFYCSTGDT